MRMSTPSRQWIAPDPIGPWIAPTARVYRAATRHGSPQPSPTLPATRICFATTTLARVRGQRGGYGGQKKGDAMEQALVSHQKQYARDKLMSMIENSFGNDFENLFHRLMSLRYPDYVPVRTHGNIGDMSADGLRLSERMLYACYAPESLDVAKIVDKFHGDLAGAAIKRQGEFDTFVFVHNDRRGGLHPVITKAMPEAQRAHPKISIHEMGPRKLWFAVMGFDRARMEELLGGPIPIDLVVCKIGMADIEPLLQHLAEARTRVTSIEPIPIPTTHKADFNRLDPDVQDELQLGRRYSYLVGRYYRDGLDVQERDEVAAGFQNYYLAMREQYGEDTDTIMYEMECYVIGQAHARTARRQAARAVLAYFFDQCDIFEVPPRDWRPEPAGGAT